MAESRKKAGPEKGAVETRSFTYLAAGVGVDPYEGNTPTLDPELEKLRDEEAKANDVPSGASIGEPTIDPELVKIRDAEIKRDAERAGIKPSSEAPTSSESAPKPSAKKSSSKSSK